MVAGFTSVRWPASCRNKWPASSEYASDTLKNDNFKPHPALKGLLEWLGKRAPNQPMRNASSRALSIYNTWTASNKDAVVQMSLFLED